MLSTHTKPTLAVAEFDYVIFGATGDLTMRKLIPALYHQRRAGAIEASSRIIGTARSPLTPADFRERVRSALERFVDLPEWDAQDVEAFLASVHYVSLDGADPLGSWDQLASAIEAPASATSRRARVFYLATAPGLYGKIAGNIAAKGLIAARSRIVLEKPIGLSLVGARDVNDAVGRYFPEESIYRIDHYLGKPAVQNILALRFRNPTIEALWDRDSIDYVQITAAETVGLEGRSGYYDGAGALRDMVQNHLLQVLSVVAMDKPTSADPDAMRDAKLAVLQSLQPLDLRHIDKSVVRGQYAAGTFDEQQVPGYRDELPEGKPTCQSLEKYPSSSSAQGRPG